LSEREDEDLVLKGRWVNSHELRAGGVLVGQDGIQRTLLSVSQEYVSGFAVNNLTIDENHTFAVGPDAILVHNTSTCDPQPGQAPNRNTTPSPAIEGSPYHPDSVAARQAQWRDHYRNEIIRTEAAELGYRTRFPPQSAPFDSHGQSVFFDEKNYITRDVDAHVGGIWKMFNRKGERIGTYDAELNPIGE
jgi:hypothetical protein